MIFGNWFWPARRRQVFCAPSTSLNTMASAVLFDRQPFERNLPRKTHIAWRGDKAMRSAFIFILGVSAVILFIIGLNLIVVPLVLGPASSTLSCDVSKLVREPRSTQDRVWQPPEDQPPI